MDTAYRTWQRRRAQTGPRHTAGRRKTKMELGPRETRRLAQLVICIAVFAVVMVGKGVFPEKMVQVRAGIAEIMGGDTDFRAAFSALGRSVSNGEPMLDTLGDLCVEVFGGSRMTVAAPIEKLLPSYEGQKAFLNTPASVTALVHRFDRQKEPDVTPPPAQNPQPTAPQPVAPTAEVPAAPAVIHVDYTGPTLPDNVTMDNYALGLAATMNPVTGWWVASGFGWREHPVDGGEKFHNGVDLAVNDGTDVRSFADGVVDYIGESPVYGLYTQVRHANGVTTFYAHNSRLCVQQGQTVKMGDKLAESGETGNTTGPHLHFEVKMDGKLLNPTYYLKAE